MNTAKSNDIRRTLTLTRLTLAETEFRNIRRGFEARDVLTAVLTERLISLASELEELATGLQEDLRERHLSLYRKTLALLTQV